MEAKGKVKYKRSRLLFLLSISFAAFIFGPLFLNNLAAAASNATHPPHAAQSETSPIKIGMTISLSGPLKQFAANVKLGVQSYFDKINAAGGINGRKLELIVLDNKYDTVLAGKQARELIDQDQVLALIGIHGSAMITIIVPIVNEKKTLLFGVFVGTDILHKTPPDRYVINFRASYADETAAMIRGLLAAGIKPDEIAFFTQNDTYGDSVYNGAIKALKTAGYSNPENLPHGRYARSTSSVVLSAVAGGLSQIVQDAKKPPKAIILGGTYIPNVKFIQLAKKEYPHTIFLGVSGLINASDLSKDEDDKVIVTQVVPPLDSDLPAVIEYREDLKKYGGAAQPDYTSLNTYLAAKLFVMGLKQAVAENNLTREGIIDVFEKMNNVDVGIDIKISFNKNNHAAIHKVWVTIFKNGKFVPMDWSELKAKLHH